MLWNNRSCCSHSHVVCKNVLRLAGELSIVRVLNDFQLLPILLCFQ
ncbi:capsid protein [Escherichia coli]|nr:capsid protein [Escherichia coli]MDT4381918.1 capsid protein [Escherichia coli]MDT4541171.1 capsid protein [Escherichia coli]